MKNHHRTILIASCLAAILPAGCRGREAAMRVALIPPQNESAIAERAEALGERYGLAVDRLEPADLIARSFNAERYPVAVCTGGEEYLLKVRRPGDATEALLRYLKDGGTLVVCGGVWPFHHPVEAFGHGQYSETPLRVADVPESPDAWVEKQMAPLRKSRTVHFNGALGLNISGTGTKWFETPPEPVAFYAEGGQKLFRDLPATWGFPSSGEQRYRPVSGRDLASGVQFTPLLRLKGASGTDYGPGAALVRHESAGQVIYVWSPIIAGNLGEGVLRDCFIYAASQRPAAGSEDATLLLARAKVLRGSAKSLRKRVDEVVATRISPSYFQRQCEDAEAGLADALTAIRLGSLDLARERIDGIETDLSVLGRRVRAIAAGTKARQ